MSDPHKQSLHRALTFLHSPHTPAILRAAIPAAASLIERTTQPGSEQRFSQLCALLGDGIIGSVWMYGLEDVDAIEASVDVLPVVVHALGMGTTRYLKVHSIVPRRYSEVDKMLGFGSTTHTPTTSGSLQEATHSVAVVFPSCIRSSYKRVCPTH